MSHLGLFHFIVNCECEGFEFIIGGPMCLQKRGTHGCLSQGGPHLRIKYTIMGSTTKDLDLNNANLIINVNTYLNP